MQVSLSVMTPEVATAEEQWQRAQRVKSFVKEDHRLEPVQETSAYITYLVSRDQEADLPKLLKHVEAERSNLGITDMQVRLTGMPCIACRQCDEKPTAWHAAAHSDG